MGVTKKNKMKNTTERQQMLDFLTKHRACTPGYEWAATSCSSLEEVWGTAQTVWLIWVATRPGILTKRELRLFAVFCASQAISLVKNPDARCVAALKVATDFANGMATAEELAAAAYAADAAAADTAAAYAAYRAAARAASAADHADAVAAAACAYTAAYAASAADTAAAAATRAASAFADARAAQSKWLRENTTPIFS